MKENNNELIVERNRKISKGSIILAFVSVAVLFLCIGLILSIYVLPTQNVFPKLESPSESTEEVSSMNNEDDKSLNPESNRIITGKNPVVSIAKKVSPAVVGIRSTQVQFIQGQPLKEQDISFGSGFFISDEGYLITNHHVIDGADKVSVVFSDGHETEAEIIGRDSFTDIAVLQVNDEAITVAQIGNSEKVEVGELAVAIGSPLGEQLGGSVTVGYISAIHRLVKGSEYLQTDAAINPGNSGGPLVNESGEVIGVNALKTYLAGIDQYGIPIASEGIGFAIPINHAYDIANQLIESGTVERPGIGIQYYAMTADDSELWKVPRGALVRSVSPNGPADYAGMRENDIILGINGEVIDDPSLLPNIIGKHDPGDEITIQVWRNRKEIDINLILGDLNKLK